MSATDKAKILDGEERPIEAANAYEAAIKRFDVDLETYLNLAVIYWVATDCGYFSFHQLPVDFVMKAERRARELLDEAERRFGDHNEIDFWCYYFDHISFSLVAKPDYCVKLARKGPSHIPYFHLFALTHDEEYREEARSLLEEVEPPTTERKRYVQSVLRSALRLSEKREARS